MITDYSRKIELTGNNKNYCSICDCDYEAYVKTIFYKMPKILIIHPGRKNRGIKYDIRIHFEEKLDIKLSDNLKNKIISYNLIGKIYHYGGIGYAGHYIAYYKIDDIWYEFDDSKILKIDINKITGEGILLFVYEKLKIESKPYFN